jgi:hypothetical protein
MRFSFKPSLAPQVVSGRKITTIRNCAGRMPRVGMPFTAVTGKRYSPIILLRATIVEVLPIEVEIRSDALAIWLDRKQLQAKEIERLATFEGFSGPEVMRRFFYALYGRTVLVGETYRLIRWGKVENCSPFVFIKDRLQDND